MGRCTQSFNCVSAIWAFVYVHKFLLWCLFLLPLWLVPICSSQFNSLPKSVLNFPLGVNGPLPCSHSTSCIISSSDLWHFLKCMCFILSSLLNHKLLARMHLVLFIFVSRFYHVLSKYYLNQTEWSDGKHGALPLYFSRYILSMIIFTSAFHK